MIDNTNIQHWEMTPYFKMAAKYRYLVVIVEPKTPWRLDVDELTRRNSHNVTREVIGGRVNKYKRIMPLYYGWFCNPADSKLLLLTGVKWLKACLENCPDFLVDFQTFSDCWTIKTMLGYFDCGMALGSGRDICHCTTKFYGSNRKREDEYATRESVLERLGEATTIEITGFTITPRTLGARILLNNEQKFV